MKQMTQILSVLIASMIAGQALAAGDAMFSLRDEDAPTGTHLRPVRMVSELPLDQTYASLESRFKQKIRDSYEKMAESDEPPFPAKGLRPLLKHILAEQDKAGIDAKGTLALLASVDDAGVVQSVSSLETPDPKLAQVAGAVLMMTPFKPPRCNGQPCKMDFLLEVGIKSIKDLGTSPLTISKEPVLTR
ncbi:hypothetical protein [Parachitinimonas caeni]|uniref:TonB C-terminal domain-containing protein n=1 Tax=Parachitinimonas caeni TaxID=3031301 RepID=A0ABT7DZP9_9NEIS|nr:hypothetical protein [Parachitinimonas caeni]MDK2125516.1 hypothetical protein [Parachitinimonas caeni]